MPSRLLTAVPRRRSMTLAPGLLDEPLQDLINIYDLIVAQESEAKKKKTGKKTRKEMKGMEKKITCKKNKKGEKEKRKNIKERKNKKKKQQILLQIIHLLGSRDKKMTVNRFARYVKSSAFPRCACSTCSTCITAVRVWQRWQHSPGRDKSQWQWKQWCDGNKVCPFR